MLKKLFYIPYTLIRWLILITILLSLLLLLIVEHPSFALNLVKGSLEEQNISYESIEGGLLSGFTLKNVNYQDQLKASEVGLKVDLEQLRNRVLYINEITLTGVEVKQEFLASLVDSNSSDENKSESNTTLPFDSIVLEHADIDLNNIVYENYDIKKAKLEVRNLSSDMKKQHKGDVKLLLESNVTHLDFNASINNEKLKMIATVVPNRNFINPLISEQNITLTSNPHLLLKADGNMQEILNYHLTANHLEIKQNEHRIKGEKLLLFGNYNMAKSNLEATLDTKLDGSMAYLKANAHTKLNLDDLNNTLNYKLETTINPKAQFLSALLSEQNISLQASPNIHLKSSGSLNKLTYHLTATQLKLKQNEYQVHKGKIELQGDYSVLEQDLKAKLTSAIDTNMANLDLQADTKLNLTDINNTLVFDIQSNIAGKKDFAGAKLSEQNITLITLPQMNINAKGTLKEAIFDTNIRGFKAKQNDINIELQSLLLKGKTNALKGDTDLELSSDFDSSAGSGHLDTLATLNFNQLEETLTFDAKSNIDANAVFINPFIKKEGITVKGSPKLLLEAKGNLQNITAKLNANAQVLKDNNLSKITLQSTPINLNLKDHTVEGSIKLASDSKNMGLNLQSNFKGDYTNPQALQTDTKLNLKNFNAFGLNLDPIAPLKLLIQNGANGAIVKIDSERIKLNAKTADHDHFSFDIKTRNLYLYKMMELPPELDHKFVKLDLAGTAILSKEFFDIKGDIHSNKKFKAHINAKNNTSGIDALIKTQYLIASLQGNLKTKNLKAEIQSGSLKKLQKELNA
ncbi:MAG: hypothetical protein K0U38_02250, partial [Epsilonproteobacteria bacterium]|nr:hypothetical protein [Campylobacterota bacterium]